MPRLIDQIKQLLPLFAKSEQPPALIGGLALAVHNVVRATRDIDFLADSDDADRLHRILLELGYRCIHRSEDAANYVRDDEGLDLLYAHRPIARRLLAEAEERDTALGRLRVISAEGLIAFKLQGAVNDPTRTRDLDDIRSLLRPTGQRSTWRKSPTTSDCSSGSNFSMSSSHNSTDRRASTLSEPEIFLVEHGGLPAQLSPSRDPISAWIELMEVVEALCPRWPEPAPRRGGSVYRL